MIRERGVDRTNAWIRIIWVPEMTQHVNYASTQIAMNLNVKGQEIQHKIGHSQK